MQYLRAQYGQDTQLVYVCGTDKLSELSIWYKAEGIFELSRFLVIPRDGDEPEKMIEKISFLKERRDRILISHEPRIYPDFRFGKASKLEMENGKKWFQRRLQQIWRLCKNYKSYMVRFENLKIRI